MKKRIIPLLLALCLSATLLPTVASAANSPTRDEAVKWLYGQEGVWHDLDNKYGAQCSDLVSAYMNWLYSGDTNPYQGYLVYNASYYPTVAGWNTDRWAVYSNTSSFVPEAGDIYVQSAHVGVFLAGSKSSATVIDQNSWETWELANKNAGVGRAGRIYNTSVSDATHFIRYKNFSTAAIIPTVTFAAWENSNYTYIREKDAAIGQLITVSGGSCTETGMYLYDAAGRELASAKNSSYDVPQIFFKINEECGYTLTPGITYKYKFYAVVNGKTYWSNEQSFKTDGIFVPKAPDCGVVEDEPTVTFKPWENANYTYIRETDAAIGQLVTVPNGNCTETGMYLYDINGQKVASGKNGSYETAVPQIYFKINEECGYTLTPGTTYKYKFYAVVNGTYYWSDWGTFKTAGTAPSANYSISLNRSSLSLTVGDKANLSATVSPTGAVVTWESSDESVVKVTNGNITAVKSGNATITATAAGKTATCVVTVAAAASIPGPTPDPGSSGLREQEPNDTIIVANEIKLDTEINGITSKTGDKDWFKFTLPSKGSIAISFIHDYFDSSFNHWRTSIYTAENEKITSVSWKGNDTVEKKSGQLGLDAGTYFLCVEGTDSKIRNNAYQVVIEFTQSENWETEFNNTIVTADSISSNQTYYGSIMQYGDKDWYKFTLPTAGSIQVSFGHEYIDTSSNGWKMSIYTADNKKISNTSWKGNSTVTDVFKETNLPAGDYCLCVEGINDKSYGRSYWFSVQLNADDNGGEEGIVAPFKDVKADAYYAEPVKWAVDNSVTVGTSATTFSPNATCTNAQILTFIWRSAGSPTPSLANPFTNLSGNEYYAKAAVWAYSMGMVSGTAFDANKACTRAMTVEYLWKQAGSPSTAASGKFTDVSSSAAYATAVAWAVNNGITAGTSNTTFSPDSICTRGQIMTFLYRAKA